MKLTITIQSGHIEEMSGKDLKKLSRALSIIMQTATNRIPVKLETKIQYNTTETKIQRTKTEAIPQPGSKW